MAHRNYTQTSKPRLLSSGILKPSFSANAHTRVSRSSWHPQRTGTETEVETPTTTPKPVCNASAQTWCSHSFKGKQLSGSAAADDLTQKFESRNGQTGHASNAPNARVILLAPAATEILELPETSNDSTPDDVGNMLDHATKYFISWSNDDLMEGPPSLFEDMRCIHSHLEDVLTLPKDVTSSSAARRALKELMIWYQRFVDLWREAVHEALARKFYELQIQLETRLTQRLTTIHEIKFSSFVFDVAAVSKCYRLQELLGSVPDSVPCLVPEDAAQEFLDQIDHLLEAFQVATYSTEQKELWLLIWRSLKTTFTAFESGGAPASPTYTFRDRMFFDTPTIHRDLKHLLRSHEAANPRAIEDVVGEYCQYIHECQVNPDNKYESLQRSRDMPLGIHTMNSLRNFIQTGKFEPSTLSKIHFAVARFNHLTNGPVIARRWTNDVDNGEWDFIPLERNSPKTTQPPLKLEGGEDIQLSQLIPNPAAQPPSNVHNEIPEAPGKRLFKHPEGVNYRSAFDYVFYPFPETRAHELVQHEQISREMAQPGIISDGPRPMYLLDRPPRHARDTTGRIQSSRKIPGVLSWLYHSVQRWRMQRRRASRVQSPSFKKLPTRQHLKLSSLQNSPVTLDRNTRVHKSISSSSRPRLRGGGDIGHDRFITSPAGRFRFDPTSYHRKLTLLCTNLLKQRYGPTIPIDAVQIKRLLEQTSYNLDEIMRQYPALSRHQSLHPEVAPGTSTNLGPGVQAYRDNVRAFRPNQLYEEGVHGDEDSPESENLNQENRPPLGELDPGAFVGAGRDSSPAHSSAPSQTSLNRVTCHRCPIYPGQYHHYCRCPPGSDSLPPDDEAAYNDGYADGFEDGIAEGNRMGREQDPVQGEQEPEEGGEQHPDGQPDDGHSNEDQTSPSDPETDRRPFREEPHIDDTSSVQSLFQRVPLFRTALDKVRGDYLGPFRLVFQSPGGSPQRVDWANMAKSLNEFACDVNRLRDTYLDLLSEAPAPWVLRIPQNDARKPNPDHPATVELCKRAFKDVEHHHSRLLAFFDYGNPRANLSFRQQFNRFISSVRETRQLVQEYLKSKAGNANDAEDSDADTWTSESSAGAITRATSNQATVQKPTLPAKEEYEDMFVDELERELKLNRSIGDFEAAFGYKRKPKKSELVQKLMDCDQQGNVGNGATEGYRHITGDKKSRSRPKGWNLEKKLNKAP